MTRYLILALAVPAALAAQVTPQSSTPSRFVAKPYAAGPIKVGPARGTVVVVGGGAQGPEIYKAFVDAAGGPDALIIDVPNAGGNPPGPNAGQAWRTAGAKNVVVYYTTDRKVADSDSFTAVLKKAGGIWFEGGRQFHLVQDYGGTKSERGFMEVLERGGVIGGSSAGASILGDFMVRGAPSNDNMIMVYPGYENGFAYLRNVGIDQHVVARSRLPDLADSVMTKYPNLLAISEDEGTAWVIKGDTATIIGRNKAFVYNGKDKTDPGNPFLTLHPGDKYNMFTRHVISRAIDRTPVKLTTINAMFAKFNDPSAGGATVLVARDGEVYIDHAFGIGPQTRLMPRTTLPQFPLGDIGLTFSELCAQMPAQPARGGNPAPDTAGAAAAGRGRGRGGPPPTSLQNCVTRVSTPIGAHQTLATPEGVIQSSVDELYRFALGLEVPTTWRGADYRSGWRTDTYKGAQRFAAYATPDGRRAAFVRIPSTHTTIVILTNDGQFDARGTADRLLEEMTKGR